MPLAVGSLASTPFCAEAQPLRLRGDALVQGQSESPVGLVVLQGSDKERPWFDAEGLVWAGARKDDATGDVLVLTFRLKEPHGYGELRGGRFVFTTGAIRPVQIDGLSAIGRTPWGASVEAMGGVPVVPRFGARTYDWVSGGRIAQKIGSEATVGFSYVQQREDGELADEELGGDLAFAPARWLDFAARSAYDIDDPGVTDAYASAVGRLGDWRVELFGQHLSPSRLLPATSLFSVLGDFPSDSVGATLRWRAAPRLDLFASGAGQAVGTDLGGNGFLRATLRLDDRGDGNMGLELRRQDVSTAQWTGVRYVGGYPLGRGWRYSTELEVAFPDAPQGRGAVWPWGLMALSWRRKDGWEVAGATEASSTPQHTFEVDALVRVSRALEFK